MIRILIFLFVFLSIYGCGFKPMYKLDGVGIELNRLSIEFKGDFSYEIKEELKKFLNTNQENSDYIVSVGVKEEEVPVIINENGTVSKYQIDIALFFEVTNRSRELLLNDIAVGFAQYDVLTSEIENKDLKKQMIRSATADAASLMITKVQSKLPLVNDN